MKKFLLAIVALALPVARGEAAMAAVTARPNILIILADDLGWHQLGCYGSSYYETPNLDRLAVEGMRFTDAYAAAPVCSPIRSYASPRSSA